LADQESKIVELLKEVLVKVDEIYRILATTPHYRERLQHEIEPIILKISSAESFRQLHEIRTMNQEMLSRLGDISQKVDMSLKGVHPQAGCGGNLELTVEGQKLKLVCLKNPSHRWEIDGVRAV
jgi:hypothetical protein